MAVSIAICPVARMSAQIRGTIDKKIKIEIKKGYSTLFVHFGLPETQFMDTFTVPDLIMNHVFVDPACGSMTH